MDIVKSSYSLEGIRLKNVAYEALTSEQAREFENDPGRIYFSRTVEKNESEKEVSYCVSLRVEIYPKAGDTPFLSVEMEGVFLAHADMPKDLAERVTNVQAPAILFPYVREFVSTLTLNSNMNPLTLPLVNLGAVFEKSSTSDI